MMSDPVAAQYDLFILHADADTSWVEGYLLPELGQAARRVIRRKHFRPGRPEAQELEQTITGSRFVVLVISGTFQADVWSTFGTDLTVYANVKDGSRRLIPLLREASDLPLRIKHLVKLDCADDERWAEEVARLRDLLGAPEEPAEAPIPCPYPGMRAFGFTPEDAALFFGRDNEIDRMLNLLRLHHLLLVIGPSGSGKSSLVFAGLLPRLAAGAGDFGAGHWRIVHMRPGVTPMERLTQALGGNLARQVEWVTEHLAVPPPATCLLLVIDQFEELFAQAAADEKQRFIAALKELSGLSNCVVVLTLRADFYGQLMDSALWPVDESRRVELVPLQGEALQAAIERPARKVGVYIEPTLVQRLAFDVANQPGGLPLLQETLRLLWSKWRRWLLTLSTYQVMGRDGQSGLAVTAFDRADAIIAGFSEIQQRIARRIFLCLVQLGEGGTDTRRQQPLSELAGDRDSADDFKHVLDTLTEARLLIRSDHTADGTTRHEPLVDISHDVLIAGWPRLRLWLNEDRAGLVILRRLEQASEDWIKRQHDPDFLFGGARLVEAEAYVAKHPEDVSLEVTTFLEDSRARERVRERSRYLGQAAGGALGAALGYSLAFSLAYLPSANSLSDLTVLFMAMFPVGLVVGFSLGIGLWLFRNDQRRRKVATSLIGLVAGSISFATFTVLAVPDGRSMLGVLLIFGACLGVGIGFGAGLPSARGRRLWSMALGGVVGTALGLVSMALGAMVIMVQPAASTALPWHTLMTLVGGFALGGLTATGLEITSVDNNYLVV